MLVAQALDDLQAARLTTEQALTLVAQMAWDAATEETIATMRPAAAGDAPHLADVTDAPSEGGRVRTEAEPPRPQRDGDNGLTPTGNRGPGGAAPETTSSERRVTRPRGI